MMYARNAAGELIEAIRGANGFCPLCSAALRPKCGRVYVHHWSHVAADCDPWAEREGPWHRGWKELFPKDCREVVVGGHRADVRLPNGWVVELQHSAISVDDVEERESVYGRMMWIIDVQKA